MLELGMLLSSCPAVLFVSLVRNIARSSLLGVDFVHGYGFHRLRRRSCVALAMF